MLLLIGDRRTGESVTRCGDHMIAWLGGKDHISMLAQRRNERATDAGHAMHAQHIIDRGETASTGRYRAPIAGLSGASIHDIDEVPDHVGIAHAADNEGIHDGKPEVMHAGTQSRRQAIDNIDRIFFRAAVREGETGCVHFRPLRTSRLMTRCCNPRSSAAVCRLGSGSAARRRVQRGRRGFMRYPVERESRRPAAVLRRLPSADAQL